MSLDKNLALLAYDKRMTQWNINHKVITEKELKKHIESLEDLSALAAPMTGESADSKKTTKKES